jgi:hypothetical protein
VDFTAKSLGSAEPRGDAMRSGSSLAGLSVLCARRGYKTVVAAVAHRLRRIFFAMFHVSADLGVTRMGVAHSDSERTTYDYRLRRNHPPG